MPLSPRSGRSRARRSDGVKREPVAPTTSSLSSPSSLPRPIFRDEPRTFSTKKERQTPRFRPPPRPPAKTCPPVSRVFKRRPDFLAPHQPRAVTFLDSPDGSLTGTPMKSELYDGSKPASYFEQAFSVEGVVGAGYFGAVVRARHLQDGSLYAVKIAKEKYRGTGDRNRKLEEVRKHQFLLPHPNCVHFYHSWEEDGRLYQQFELCETSLADLAEKKHELPEELIWSYLVDLLYALEHLHDHNLIHMDIKPENIFVGRDGLCKLGDFGLVIDLSMEGGGSGGMVPGDSKYMASELLDHTFSKAADIFSLGVTILELATDLDPPSGGHLWHELRNTGPDPKLTAHLSADLRRVLQLMMGKDPQRRPTVKQLLELPAVKRARNARATQLRTQTLVRFVRAVLLPIYLIVAALFSLFLGRPISRMLSALRRKLNSKLEEQGTPTQDMASKAKVKEQQQNLRHLLGSSFSSDEDDTWPGADHSSSELAAPLPQDSSPSNVRRVSFKPDEDESGFEQQPLLPSPIRASGHYPRGPRRLLQEQTQSTPSGMRLRARVDKTAAASSTENGVLPQKKLNFDELEHSIAQLEESSDESSSKIKPISLAEKFDCFSDDNSDRE